MWMETFCSPRPDLQHYRKARHQAGLEPPDLAAIPHPRLGIMGIIDDGINWNLLEVIVTYRPQYQITVIGPLTGNTDGRLPRHERIHYLGLKSYDELPAYLAGWDVALIPFLPGKTARNNLWARVNEYLAAGKLVVSTPVPEVILPFGSQGLVFVAGTEKRFLQAVDTALELNQKKDAWLHRVEEYLALL